MEDMKETQYDMTTKNMQYIEYLFYSNLHLCFAIQFHSLMVHFVSHLPKPNIYTVPIRFHLSGFKSGETSWLCCAVIGYPG